jgi:ankyrin repeat protein
MDRTDLHSAALEGGAERVKELLKKGANPNIQDEKGRTPLHEAAHEGRVDVVKLLLVHGADPAVKDKDGRTPLDLARAEGRREVVLVIEEWLRRGGGPSQRRF